MSHDSWTKSDAGARRARRYARRLTRGACLAAALLALWPTPEWPESAALVPAASPFVAVASSLATRTLPAAAVAGLLVGLVAAFRRRWFCRWVCPAGLCVDGAGRLGLRLGRTCPRLPRLGQWIALLTLGGACLGYPVLVWLDPMALLAAAFSLIGPRPMPVPWWAAAGLPAVLLASVLLPRAWCLRVCPLGAMQDIVWQIAGVFRRGRSAGRPDGASAGQIRLARRSVLLAAAGALGAVAVGRGRAAAARRLRPPGAIDEAEFTGVCIRCGNCLRACPAVIIEPDLAGGRIAGFLAPILSFERDYCREDCTRCMDACPSGALVPPAAGDKQQAPIGLPRVDMDVCLLGDDRDCAVCRSRCPFEAITLLFCEETYTLTPQIDAERCPGCGACEAACPTTPVKAIVVCPR